MLIELFGATEVYSSEKKNFSISRKKFFIIGELWIALMEGNPIERSYNHIAFQIEEGDIEYFEAKIQKLNLELIPSRPRAPQEGKSLYFYDYDNHLFEVHTGNLRARLNYYNKENCLNPESN